MSNNPNEMTEEFRAMYRVDSGEGPPAGSARQTVPTYLQLVDFHVGPSSDEGAPEGAGRVVTLTMRHPENDSIQLWEFQTDAMTAFALGHQILVTVRDDSNEGDYEMMKAFAARSGYDVDV